MRRKSPPTPHAPPPLRRPRAPSHTLHWHSHLTDVWAHAEWFLPFLDAPFFNHSEFAHIMLAAMNLPSLRLSATRLQLSRVRAAMCNAIPGRFAQPRRLSAAFLAAEVDELLMYRADARRVLRAQPLLPADDPTTHTPLQPHWWTRYRCPPPEKPAPNAPLFVRTTATPPDHLPFPVSSDSSLKAPSQRVFVRPAVFLAFHSDAHVLVRFTDDLGTETSVHDLDVMLQRPTPPLPPTLTPPASLSHTVDHSPLSSRLAFSPQMPLFDPLAIDLPRPVDGPLPISQLYSSPRPAFPPSPGTVELEVDVRQVAESMRLLDRKTELLCSLRALNDAVESLPPQQTGPPMLSDLQHQCDQFLRELSVINDDLRLVRAPQVPLTPAEHDFTAHPPSLGRIRLSLPGADEEDEEEEAGADDGRAVAVLNFNSPDSRDADTVRRRRVRTALGREGSNGADGANGAGSDFADASGAVKLAKVLARDALARLPAQQVVKAVANETRMDVMECVSACVTVLLRARTTRDFDSIERVVQTVPVRFAENGEALEAIHMAAKAFDSSFNSDSL